MKKIEIEIPEGKEAKWVNGVLTLVEVEDNRPITERIKTFDDACKALGEDHLYVQMFRDIFNKSEKAGANANSDVVAYLKLRIITAALNEGWEPKFTTDEWRWYPWFRLLTKSEIEELSEEEKCRVVGRAFSSAYAYGGLVYAYAYNVSTYSSSGVGSRLAFKNEELADYAGTQFAEIYADFCFIPASTNDCH